MNPAEPSANRVPDPGANRVQDPGFVIRDLATHEDLLACVALQREVWGAEFEDCVPPALLKVTQRVGGLAAGAFDEDGALLGFVYGITGRTRGRRVHWSHMLAVTPAARGIGIGRMLKEYQRRTVAEWGVEAIQWSFDPLVSRNAHLNLNNLGATVAEYVESMYPPMASKLHGTLPVDRLIVEWRTDGSPRAGGSPSAGEQAAKGRGDDRGSGVAVLDWRHDGLDTAALGRELNGARSVAITVPRDFEELVQSSPSAALEIRLRTRAFFSYCLEHGYRVDGFNRGGSGDPHYILHRS